MPCRKSAYQQSLQLGFGYSESLSRRPSFSAMKPPMLVAMQMVLLTLLLPDVAKPKAQRLSPMSLGYEIA